MPTTKKTARRAAKKAPQDRGAFSKAEEAQAKAIQEQQAEIEKRGYDMISRVDENGLVPVEEFKLHKVSLARVALLHTTGNQLIAGGGSGGGDMTLDMILDVAKFILIHERTIKEARELVAHPDRLDELAWEMADSIEASRLKILEREVIIFIKAYCQHKATPIPDDQSKDAKELITSKDDKAKNQ